MSANDLTERLAEALRVADDEALVTNFGQIAATYEELARALLPILAEREEAAERRGAEQALRNLRDHCDRRAGAPVAPGCPAAADYRFWIRMAAAIDEFCAVHLGGAS